MLVHCCAKVRLKMGLYAGVGAVLCASDRQKLTAANLIVIMIKGAIAVPPTCTHTYINATINSGKGSRGLGREDQMEGTIKTIHLSANTLQLLSLFCLSPPFLPSQIFCLIGLELECSRAKMGQTPKQTHTHTG